MVSSVARRELVVFPGESIVLLKGKFHEISVMKGGDLEFGEEVDVDRVVLNADSRHPVAIGLDNPFAGNDLHQ